MSSDASPKVADVASRDVEPFRCERCGVPFTTGEDLRRHIQLTHKGGKIEANEKPSAPSKKSKRKSGKSAENKATKTKSKTRRKVDPIRKTRTRARRK
jgi:uncharacterized C2H2 Zn-finger protein